MADTDTHNIAAQLRHVAKSVEDGKVVGLSLVTYGADSRTLTSIPSPGPHALAFLGLIHVAISAITQETRRQAAEPVPSPIKVPTAAAQNLVKRTKQ